MSTRLDLRPAASPLRAEAFERAALETIAYADVFDYPLSLPELHRFLGLRCGLRDVERAVSLGLPGPVVQRDGLLLLAGREPLVDVRRHRRAVARRLWPRAVRYGRLIAALPFVRLVAVSGALAVDNVESEDDIDYFIVSAPGRAWTCRALTIAVVRVAAARGVVLCPNYIVSERAMVMDDRTLFTAHEIVQLVPISGSAVYRRFRNANGWTDQFLPNATDAPGRGDGAPGASGRWVALIERAGKGALGRRFERWERVRKVRRFSAGGRLPPEAAFGEEYCKGHVDAHRDRVLRAFDDRLAGLGMATRAVTTARSTSVDGGRT